MRLQVLALPMIGFWPSGQTTALVIRDVVHGVLAVLVVYFIGKKRQYYQYQQLLSQMNGSDGTHRENFTLRTIMNKIEAKTRHDTT
jgi:hypothetical protein